MTETSETETEPVEGLTFDNATIGAVLDKDNDETFTNALSPRTPRGWLLARMRLTQAARDESAHRAAEARREAEQADARADALSKEIGAFMGAIRDLDKGTDHEEK